MRLLTQTTILLREFLYAKTEFQP